MKIKMIPETSRDRIDGLEKCFRDIIKISKLRFRGSTKDEVQRLKLKYLRSAQDLSRIAKGHHSSSRFENYISAREEFLQAGFCSLKLGEIEVAVELFLQAADCDRKAHQGKRSNLGNSVANDYVKSLIYQQAKRDACDEFLESYLFGEGRVYDTSCFSEL